MTKPRSPDGSLLDRLRRLLPGRRRTTPTALTDPRHQLGRLGEALAERYLTHAGYRCAERNLRTRHAEIDLLVRRGRLWIAVEVKTRRAHAAPEVFVDETTRQRLLVALIALAPTLYPRARALRVDVVAVRLEDGAAPEIRHFPGAGIDV